MRERLEVFVVRPRFQPPLVEQATIGATGSEGTELRFAPRVPLKPGEHVKLLAKTENGRFTCRALTTNGTPGAIRVKTGGWTRLELRQNARVPAAFPAIIRTGPGREMSATVENISTGGFLVTTPSLPKSQDLLLVVMADETPDEFPCVIVDSRWIEGRHCIHLALNTGNERLVARLAAIFEREFAASQAEEGEAAEAAA